MDLIWKSALLIFTGVGFLRIAGRKSISQMTIVQTVIMISIGTLIVEPIVNKSIWRAIAAAGIFVIATILMEYLQIKFNFMEQIFIGKAKPVIVNGKFVIENLKKMRLTVDQLEMRLRQQGIQKITDVKTATLEPNGQLGYELFEDAQPLTVGQFKKIMNSLLIKQPKQSQTQETANIFSEAVNDGHEFNSPHSLH